MYFDTHFHLNDHQYQNEDHDLIIKQAKDANLVGIINVSAAYFEASKVVKQSYKYDFMYAAIGVHPSAVDKLKEEDVDHLEQLIIDDRSSNGQNKIKAIGECGLDFYYDHYPDRKIQTKWFIKQVKLAVKYDLTLVIHSRNAASETMDIIKKYKPPRVIIHCFTYDAKVAQEFVDLGCYLSFSGIVTFKKKVEDIQMAAQITPLDKLLCETDAPLLTPEPFRGKTNYAHHIIHTYQKIEELRGEKIVDQVLANVKKVFGI